MNKIILSVLFITSFGVTNGDVGTTKFRNDGEDASVGEFPYIAHLFDNFYEYSWCSGVVINEEWVITSSRCTTQGNNGLVFTAGQVNIEIDEGNEQASRVVAVILHPDNDTPHFNGMALMKVSPPFIFNDFVQPARLSSTVMEQTVNCTVAGWETDATEETYPILRKIDLERVPDDLCEELHNYPQPYRVMCAAGKNGSDSGNCIGDFGGPLICHDVEQGNFLCGISYEGSDYSCTGQKPRLFTKIEPMVDWIHETIENYDGTNEISWTETTTCGGVLTSSGGKINYKVGEHYDENERCVWTIRSDARNTVLYRFQDYELAENDWVGRARILDITGEIYDFYKLDPSGVTYSNGVINFIVFFTGGTNKTNSGQGFSFVYSHFEESFYPPALNYHHEHHKNSQGFVSYPSGAVEYQNNEIATWVLNPNSFNAQLTISRFDIDRGNDSTSWCYSDYLYVYGLTLNGRINRELQLCGTSSELYREQTSAGVFIVVFRSDGQDQAAGFDFSWETLPDSTTTTTIPTTTGETAASSSTPKTSTSLSTNSTTVIVDTTTVATTPRSNSTTSLPSSISSSISTTTSNPSTATLSTTVLLPNTTTSNLETTTVREEISGAIRINPMQNLSLAAFLFTVMFILNYINLRL